MAYVYMSKKIIRAPDGVLVHVMSNGLSYAKSQNGVWEVLL
jgi:hypothetical protein